MEASELVRLATLAKLSDDPAFLETITPQLKEMTRFFDRLMEADCPEIRTEGPSAGLREDRNQPSLSQCQALNGMGREEAGEMGKGWFLFETGKGEPR